MVSSSAKTVEAYLKSLPLERARVLREVRNSILKNLPKGIEETMNWGMISYEIPLTTYPKTNNEKPLSFAGLAAQKSNYALYLMNVYSDPDLASWFKGEFAKRGIKLDMGKSCVRFKKLDELPLDVIGRVIGQVTMKEFIARYESTRKK